MKDQKDYILFKQNSELEVLISAAIVFTVFAINDLTGSLIIDALNSNVSNSSPAIFISAIVGLYMSAILPISIISHFILRIYWLSLVGLKAVFPERKEMSVNDQFDQHVNRSLDLEKTIHRVDKICSSIFAFTFLTLFAFCFSFITSAVITIRLASFGGILPTVVLFVFLALAVIYFIDFITLGLFKKIKNKTFARLYYPIYKFFGWITLAFLYRGIYYSLIQHASRKVMLILTPLYILLAIGLMNMGYESNSFYPDIYQGAFTGQLASPVNYRDQFPDRTIMSMPFTDSFIIPADQNYIKVYLPLDRGLEYDIGKCAGVEKYNERGVHWRNWVKTDFNRLEYDSAFSYEGNSQKILDCVANNIYLIINDNDTIQNNRYYFSKLDQPEDYAVIFSVLDISELPIGDHDLTVSQSEQFGESNVVIPFWRD